MKVLRICSYPDRDLRTGRGLLSDVNGDALRSLFGEDLIDFMLDSSKKPQGLLERIYAVLGWLNGLDQTRVQMCIDLIRSHNISVAYVEGSNYGRIVRAIKRQQPSCKLVTFFHNVETRFFWGAFCTKPTVKSLGVLIANFVAEVFAVRYSDRIICLTRRDSDLLNRIFRRSATDIHPLCIADGATISCESVAPSSVPKSLFVGGAFYANLEGMRWFAKNVAAHLPCTTYVVGKGFEEHKQELEAFGNLEVIGTVENLQPWYNDAALVIAPIFDGSGMKTKVAEALMYGRPVVGTPEAFVGYEAIANQIGFICKDAGSFITAVSHAISGVRKFEPAELRSLYLEHYSLSAKNGYFRDTFGGLQKECSL